MSNNKLLDQLKKKYGTKNGTKIYLTIVPGILSDFKKMLKDAAPDTEITETYHFEDGDGGVIVRGSRAASGEMKIEAELKAAE